MAHLAIVPILFPLLSGLLLLLPPLQNSVTRQRLAAILFTGLLLITSCMLLLQVTEQGIQLYTLGGWPAPFGIILMADRLGGLLVVLTALLGLCALLYACAGDDQKGAYFHPLFQFQLMGINGAFLTGDLFNLFVFFEILLIASYALLIHGGGKQKTQANVHYVILNLAGSILFLFALGILYGTLGTLNMADMALQVRQLADTNLPLTKAGGLLLLLVFGLKAALLPLHFWLPRAYASASAPVAALFTIMTKVGVYAIFRVYTVIFGTDAGALAGMATPWLWPLALLTLALGTVGALASLNLRKLTANLILVSIGTLLVAAALQREAATAAALYYLIHTTLVSAALFLLADMIGRQRGKAHDRFVTARRLAQPALLGSAFFLAAMAIVGMPPLSGFVGKTLLLQAVESTHKMRWFWPLLLGSGLIILIALSRAGSSLFWRISGDTPGGVAAPRLQITAVWLLLATSPLLVIFGGPVTEFTQAAAAQLHDTDTIIAHILSQASLNPGGTP